MGWGRELDILFKPLRITQQHVIKVILNIHKSFTDTNYCEFVI